MWRACSAVTLCLGLLFAGCEDPFIDPFVPGKHYTVYGFLNAFDSEHHVRVIPVRRTPEEIPDPDVPHAQIDAVVTSTDLTSKVTVPWTHHLERFTDGSYGHVYSARLVVRQGRRYRLTIRRSDGVESIAETTVPNLRAAVAAPATIIADSVSQLITWPGGGRPEKIEVAYCAKAPGAFSCNDIVVDYKRAGRLTSEGWEVPVQLGRDLLFVRQQLGFPENVVLELSNLEMRFTSLDEDWLAPTGSFDPEEFAQPGALTNVENGFGYWGSVARSIHTWVPDAAALDALGYIPPV